MNSTTDAQPDGQHTLLKSFVLHVLPGLLTTGAFVLFKPPVTSAGYPPLLAFLIAVLVIDIPFMLGAMFLEGKRLNGHLSMKGIVWYWEKTPWMTFLLVFVGAFVVLYLLMMLASPLQSLLTDHVFSWLPDWLFFDEATQYEAYSRNILVFVFTLHLLITGLALPWVEELYFRGYLMSRLSRFGKWTPFIGGVFFGFYHIWQPYGFAGIFLLGAGLGIVVWWKRDIRLSISLHLLANALVRIFLLIGILAR